MWRGVPHAQRAISTKTERKRPSVSRERGVLLGEDEGSLMLSPLGVRTEVSGVGERNRQDLCFLLCLKTSSHRQEIQR